MYNGFNLINNIMKSEVWYPMRKITGVLSIILVTCIVSGMIVVQGNEAIMGKHLTNISATDDFGRKITGVDGFKENRYVGLFYFLWLGQQNQKEIYDITEILRTDTLANLTDLSSDKYKNVSTYFFNEPLYGYYNSADPWVIRKHIELFIAANIDFLALDVTNGIFYDNVLVKLLEILEEYRSDGWKVPRIVFFTNLNSKGAVSHFYNSIYKQGKYKELWFYGPYSKPLIIANPDELTQDMLDFFYVRPPQWPLDVKHEEGFPYMNISKPQDIYTNLINVSVSQFAGPCSDAVIKGYGVNERFYGRGYSSATGKNNVVKNILRGENFKEQWEYAIKADPEIVFVTGWNEWIAQKNEQGYGWIDTFNTEWSRDIEMTKKRSYSSEDANDYTSQGYGDNFYLQLVDYVRKFKGIRNENEKSKPQTATMDVYGAPSAWDAINEERNVFYNIAAKNAARNFKGASPGITYTTAEALNFIRKVRVTNDDKNLYFCIETDEPIKEDPDKDNILNLLISLPGSKSAKKSWEGYQYIINRKPSADGVTSLEKVSEEGKYTFIEVSKVKYSIQGNVMQVEVPLKDLGIRKNEVHIEFKVCDSIEHPDDIMDYYVTGSSAPIGRINFVYENYSIIKGNMSKLELILAISALSLIGVSVLFFVNRSIKLKKKNQEVTE